MDEQRVKKYMVSRTNLVDGLIDVLGRKVEAAERSLLKSTVEGFVDRLELTPDGRVRNTLFNKRLLGTIDNIFTDFGKTLGVELAKTVAQGVQAVANFNASYYQMFTTKAKLLPIAKSVQETLKSWIGIDGNKVKPNGYLDTLIKDTTVKSNIKDFAVRAVVGQQGWRGSKEELKNIIVGEEGKTGKLSQYYRNFVYDMYSQVDRATSSEYASKLKFEFAIYEGGLIKTSRPFCKERNGQVFHVSEIEQFDPKVAKPPNYNPFTDLGGYACRHHLNYIPNALALMLRPDAVEFIRNDESKKPADKIQPLIDATAEELKKIGRPDNTIYSDNYADSISSMKTAEQLRKELGAPIFTKNLYGKPNEILPDAVVKEMRYAGGKEGLKSIFANTKTTKIKIKDLVFSQEFVFENPLKNSQGIKAISVIKSGGKYYVIDGNHSAAKAFLMGKKDLDVKILDIDAVKKPKAVPAPAKRIDIEAGKLEKVVNSPTAKKYLHDVLERFVGEGVKPPITISSSLTGAKIKEYVKQVGELFRDYNIKSTVIEKITFKSRSNAYGYVKTYQSSGRISEINFGDRTNRLRANEWSDAAENLSRKFNSKVDKDKITISTTTHEFAHVIGSSFLSKSKPFFDEVSKIKARYHEELNGLIREGNIEGAAKINLGRYASTNVDEFWAESFTEYKLSSSPTKYAKIVGELGDKYFKK